MSNGTPAVRLAGTVKAKWSAGAGVTLTNTLPMTKPVMVSVAAVAGCPHEARTPAGGEIPVVLQGPVAVAQQHAHAVAKEVGHHQVGFAVAVDVRHRYRKRTVADGEVLGALEGAVAVAQQHAHRP